MGKVPGFVAARFGGALEPGDGFVVALLFDQVRANVVVRIAEIGIDLDGALALRDGFVDAALEMITPAKKRMGLGRGVQFKRRLIELDGAIVIAFHLRLIGVLQDFPRAGEGLHAHEGLLAQRFAGVKSTKVREECKKATCTL